MLLVERSARLVFHGGAWVFPGGRVEAADLAGEPAVELGPARRAAARETLEETGLRPSPGALVPMAHWTTPPGRPRRFRTWFFLTEAPRDRVRVDGGEIRDHRWLRPEAALEAHAEGRMRLPPPTYVTLVRLAHHGSAAEALDAWRARPVEWFTPRPRAMDDGHCSLYEGDVAYDGGGLDAPGPRHRLWMVRGGWRYERVLGGRGGDP